MYYAWDLEGVAKTKAFILGKTARRVPWKCGRSGMERQWVVVYVGGRSRRALEGNRRDFGF